MRIVEAPCGAYLCGTAVGVAGGALFDGGADGCALGSAVGPVLGAGTALARAGTPLLLGAGACTCEGDAAGTGPG